jgi:hypothetical protein
MSAQNPRTVRGTIITGGKPGVTSGTGRSASPGQSCRVNVTQPAGRIVQALKLRRRATRTSGLLPEAIPRAAAFSNLD